MFHKQTIAQYASPKVKALLHFEGTDGSTTFHDEYSANDWTVHTNQPVISTAAPKFGTGALGSTLSGSTIQSPQSYAVGLKDFTIGFWWRGKSATGAFIYDPVTALFGIQVHRTAGTFSWVLPGVTYLNSPSGITADTWAHFAVERYQGTLRCYLNGVQGATADGSAIDYGTNPLRLTVNDGTVLSYLDEVRLVVGQGEYQGTNFTPRSEAYSPP